MCTFRVSNLFQLVALCLQRSYETRCVLQETMALKHCPSNVNSTQMSLEAKQAKTCALHSGLQCLQKQSCLRSKLCRQDNSNAHIFPPLSICSLHLPQLPQQASCSITRQDLHVAPLEVPTCFELIALPLAQFESH